MWKQDSVSAPLTPTKVIDQIVNSLTDPASGFILFDDMRVSGTTPYVVLRNNRGAAKDMYLYISTVVQDSITIRVKCAIYEAWSSSGHVGTNSCNLGYRDILIGTNLLVNVAASPDMTALAFWFKQNAPIDPWLISVIEPHRDGGGNLLNVGDDGTGWPLWGALDSEPDVGRIRLRALAGDEADMLPSTYRYGHANGNNNNLGGLWFKVVRTPIGNQTYQLHIIGSGYGYGTNDYDTSKDKANFFFPKRRCSAWAGSATLAEGFAPLLWSSKLGPDDYHELDWRGYLGTANNVILSSEFGGSPEDSFDYNGSTYRIIFSTRGYNNNGLIPASIAIKVA